jgi:catecholate siderophore receptor
MEDPTVTTPLTDLYNPDPHGAYSPILDNPIGDTRAEADTTALYVFDTMILSPQWEISGGLRWDRFETESLMWQAAVPATPTTPAIPAGWITPGRTDTELNGRIGVVFKPVEHGSIYAAYGTSFNPSAEGMSLNPALAAVKPEESRTAELGTKWNLFDGRLMLTSAIFRTEKTNVRIDVDPTSATQYALDGEQRVDGFEIAAAGRITDAWTINFGYAFLDGEVLSNRAAPTEVGNELPNTPEHSANLWTSYDINDDWVVGFGVQHVGSRYTSTNNERLAKAYTTYDMMVGYTINDTVALRLNGYNLSNKEYVDRVGGGHYVPGAERTWMLSADFSF